MAQEGKLVSTKRIKIDKANQTIVTILAACSFIFVFSLVASKELINQYQYQNRVTSASQATVNQLNSNKQATTSLLASYNSFINQSTNMIGGSSTGSGNQDGTNSKIILDALPDKYDFPALVTSVQNLISGQGVTVNAITGTDSGGGASTPDSVSATATLPTTSTTPGAPIAMPFTFTVEGSYASIQNVLSNLEKSIRPIQIQTLNFTGSDNNLTLVVNAQTFYLPATGLNISTETVK